MISETGLSDAIDQGITVTEIAAMDLPIEVAAETTAAFVGRALRGPLNTPLKIDSFAAFKRRFGGDWHRSSLGPAVRLFFEHGGMNLYVVRVANNARGAMIALPSSGGVLVLHALEPGSTENIRASVDYDGIDAADKDHFNLVVQRIAPDTGLVVDQEIFNRISCVDDSTATVTSALLQSSLVRVRTPLPPGRPAATVTDDVGCTASYVTHAQSGSDGAALSDYDLIGSAARNTGIFALNQIEHFDLLYVPPPARQRDPGPTAMLVAERYCRQRGAMLVMDPPASWNSVEKVIQGVRDSGYASSNVIAYFPRVINSREASTTPQVAGGAIAGLLCKLDRMRGPWDDLDQPALGLVTKLQPALQLSSRDARLLVREGLNVIAREPAGRAMVCGSVTLGRGSQMDRKFSSLTVRRLCLKITNAIERSTRWALFAADGQQMTERVHIQVDGYMSHLAESGAFEGGRFVVHCESALDSKATDPDRGVTILLAFRPAGTDEDVALTLKQTIAGCRVTTTAFAPVVAEVA
jgi:hypothetical protein